MIDYDLADASQHFADLAKLTEAFFGLGQHRPATVEDNLREELRLIEASHNRCFDL